MSRLVKAKDVRVGDTLLTPSHPRFLVRRVAVNPTYKWVGFDNGSGDFGFFGWHRPDDEVVLLSERDLSK